MYISWHKHKFFLSILSDTGDVMLVQGETAFRVFQVNLAFAHDSHYLLQI